MRFDANVKFFYPMSLIDLYYELKSAIFTMKTLVFLLNHVFRVKNIAKKWGVLIEGVFECNFKCVFMGIFGRFLMIFRFLNNFGNFIDWGSIWSVFYRFLIDFFPVLRAIWWIYWYFLVIFCRYFWNLGGPGSDLGHKMVIKSQGV